MLSKIKEFFRDIQEIQCTKATEILEWELEEMENIFALLVMGCFVGIPSPPVHLMTELMPDMKREFELMLEKVATGHDPLGELFSVLDIK